MEKIGRLFRMLSLGAECLLDLFILYSDNNRSIITYIAQIQQKAQYPAIWFWEDNNFGEFEIYFANNFIYHVHTLPE